ncbi:MAG: DUF393 domain-containing protein [Spirochaetes bacterium]|nr:DUF393 domain-containing protein [Spirochaetota bacterium]MBN2770427.1 DUF393 domain-containing protein [Spirochaetota bacterium]
MKTESWTLLYDRDCPLCSRFAVIVEKLDHENMIDFVPLQDYCKKEIRFSCEELLKTVHIISEQGQVLKGGDAVCKVLMLVPASRPYRWLLKSKVGHRVSNTVYFALNSIRRCYKCNRRR